MRPEWQAERTANARAAVDAFTRTLSAQWQMTENLAARDTMTLDGGFTTHAEMEVTGTGTNEPSSTKEE